MNNKLISMNAETQKEVKRKAAREVVRNLKTLTHLNKSNWKKRDKTQINSFFQDLQTYLLSPFYSGHLKDELSDKVSELQKMNQDNFSEENINKIRDNLDYMYGALSSSADPEVMFWDDPFMG